MVFVESTSCKALRTLARLKFYIHGNYKLWCWYISPITHYLIFVNCSGFPEKGGLLILSMYLFLKRLLKEIQFYQPSYFLKREGLVSVVHSMFLPRVGILSSLKWFLTPLCWQCLPGSSCRAVRTEQSSQSDWYTECAQKLMHIPHWRPPKALFGASALWLYTQF